MIPLDLASELLDFWASPEGAESIGDVKEEVGLRGELYSYRYEREMSADPSQVVWVAQEDDTLGYDILNTASDARRLIEVKASTGEDLRFYMTQHEMNVGREKHSEYEIQFWGGIDRSRPRPEDYTKLRADGYPRVIRDFAAAVDSGEIVVTPASYLVTGSVPGR